MGSRKEKYKPKSFESAGFYSMGKAKKKVDTSANIYESMLRSAAFQDLTPRQQILYVVCKAQLYGKTKPKKDYPDISELDSDSFFYLNWAAVASYGLYTPTMHSTFYRDMTALCDHGFIRRASGAALHKKTIYQFISDWQQWGPP